MKIKSEGKRCFLQVSGLAQQLAISVLFKNICSHVMVNQSNLPRQRIQPILTKHTNSCFTSYWINWCMTTCPLQFIFFFSLKININTTKIIFMKVKKAYRKVCIYHRPFHANLASAPYQDSHCQEVCCKKKATLSLLVRLLN